MIKWEASETSEGVEEEVAVCDGYWSDVDHAWKQQLSHLWSTNQELFTVDFW